jgi:hypothetical protein
VLISSIWEELFANMTEPEMGSEPVESSSFNGENEETKSPKAASATDEEKPRRPNNCYVHGFLVSESEVGVGTEAIKNRKTKNSPARFVL